MVIFGTFVYFMVLSGITGYYKLLRCTRNYYKLLMVTTVYCRLIQGLLGVTTGVTWGYYSLLMGPIV